MMNFSVILVAAIALNSQRLFAVSDGHAHAEPPSMRDLNCKVRDEIKHSDDKYQCEVNLRGEWVGPTGKTEADSSREAWCRTLGFFCGAKE